MGDILISAPMAGWTAPLGEVPDPVFAERMMGDGVAIHPTGQTIVAPCDGTVLHLHQAGHAVTIRSTEGAEILIHLGLETVKLGGRGFRALTKAGASVRRGDPLIEVDLDAVATAATSLVTPVILTNGDDFRIASAVTGALIAAGDPLLTLERVTQAGEPASDGGLDGAMLERRVAVPMAHGIHARPAARIADMARGFDAHVDIVHGDRRVSATSTVALMALALQQGDTILIQAQGRDAAIALDALTGLIAGGMGEPTAPVAASSSRPTPPPVLPRTVPEGAIGAVCAARGIAIGKAAWLADEKVEVAEDGISPASERNALDRAVALLAERLAARAEQGSDDQRQIMSAHRLLLQDDDLRAAADRAIDDGRSAGFGWRAAIAEQVAALRNSGNARLAERADDLDDLGRQVLAILAGRDASTDGFAPGTVLLARDLLPSQLIALDTAHVVGVILEQGGPTSHVAILAAARKLPMLVAAGPALRAIAAGATVVVDADAGLAYADPEPAALADHRARVDAAATRRAAAERDAHDLCRMADGTRIEMFANLGSLADAELAMASGAEGSGLLRTEFLFMDRDTAPDEDEQAAAYAAIASALDGRPLIVRLLDIGGDKPAAYLPIAPEKNPMLGQRGVRVSLAFPDLLTSQLRAILRAAPAGQCRIMVPMIAGLDELRSVRRALADAARDLEQTHLPQLGVMIETPAAAVIADLLAAEADFLSIGTNDLTQYALAMDRENAAVAGGVDALHPAVLRLIAMTAAGGAKHGRMVAVCGGLASDPLAIPLLIGMGVTELSATPAFIPEAKALVRRLDMARCAALAERATLLPDALAVRALVGDFLEELG